MPSTSKKAKTL